MSDDIPAYDWSHLKDDTKNLRLLFWVQMIDPQDTIRGFTCQWIEALSEQCGQLVVVAQDVRNPEALSHLNNVTLLSLGKEIGHGKIRQLLCALKIMMSQVCARKVDAVLTHMAPIYSIIAYPFCALSGRTLITWFARSIKRWHVRLAGLLSDGVCTPSPADFIVPCRRLFVTGHGIATDRIPTVQDWQSHKPLLSLSRISPIKRIDLIIRAMATPELQNQKLLIAGAPILKSDFEYEQSLKHLVKELNLEGRVSFLGPIAFDQNQELREEVSLLINTSQTGSIDKAVLEAMAATLAVVSTNPAFARAFETLKGASYQAAPCSPEDLAKAIKQTLQNASSDRSQLRTWVQAKHDLKGLARLLALICQNPTQRPGFDRLFSKGRLRA